MKVDLKDTGELTSTLTIVVEPQDYKPDFDKELADYRKKVQIKGFRKGKTPLSALKKMYGKAVLADVVNKKVESTLQNYIIDNEVDILGNPLPSDDHQTIQFDVKSMGNYEYKFDLGLAPKIDVKGVGDDVTYKRYNIEVSDADIDEEVSNLQKRLGEQQEVDAPIEEKDIVELSIIESNPESEEPYDGQISVMPDRLNDEYKEQLLGAEKGKKLDVDVFQLEKDAKEDYVKKYFLKDAPESVTSDFDAKIMGVKRLVPAELNDEFYIKAFGEGGPSNEEEMRKKLKEELTQFYESQSKAITKRRILETLVEENQIALPDDFMKRWLVAANQNLSVEQIDQEYPDFVQNLKWTLIKQTLGKKYDLKIEAEDIRTSLVDKFKGQFAQYGYAAGLADLNFNDIGDRLMQNQESVQKEYEELLAERVLDKVLEEVNIESENISTDQYKDIVKELNT